MPDEPITDFKTKSLDDLLTTEQRDEPSVVDPAPDPDTPTEPVIEPEAHDAKSEGGTEPEDSKGAAIEPEKDEPPASDKKEVPQVPRAALQDERRKRQGLESKLNSMEQQLNELQKTPRPDPYENPEGAAEYDRVEGEQKDAIYRSDQFALLVKVDRRAMQREHDDYDEVESIFMDEAQTNQALAVQMSQAEFPAEFAYTEGQRLKQVQAMGDDPAGYIQTQIQEGITKALEELKKTNPAKIPESLAEAPSASTKDIKQWTGPKSIQSILNG